MSDRITRANLDARVENLNRRLDQRGSKYRWAVQARNGRIALDRTTPEGIARGTSVDVITVGTKREVGDFLRAAMVALDDSQAKG